METKEILAILKKAAAMEPAIDDNKVFGHGAINYCPECFSMSSWEYRDEFHPKMAQLLESLPWTKVVEKPRYPKADEYPEADGDYITMLDCNEHEVLVNRYRNGKWTLYNRTHIKWWMPLPEDIEKYISNNF